MNNTERIEEELAISKLCDEYQALRPIVEDADTRTPENMAEYRALNDQIAAARTDYKIKYPPSTPESGDAAATPAPIAATAKAKG